MEQDCVVALYQSVGMSAGAEFSSEDVSRLYCKVFHVPSDTGEAQTAMTKIAGGDDSWTCVGEKVFDVLLEMERERDEKEQLCWDMQMLNVGNLNSACVMNKPVKFDGVQQGKNPNTFKTACSQSDAGSLKSRNTDTGDSQMERLVGRRDLYGSVKRLKKAARRCWARLASEGVQTMLPSTWQGRRLGVKVHAWGCVSLSDVLLLVQVKYDVVTQLLYTEMLQEHHTPHFWETLQPWQRHKEHEGLEHLAEEVLISGDMLHLAELPGGFRIYRDSLRASFKNGAKIEEQSWSAVSLLYELQTSCQQEKDMLTVLGERLDGESMRLLCLHIRLATLRAQREKKSYAALLAARQSWDTWPHVMNSCRPEQAALWLQGEEEEQIEDLTAVSPQQHSVLQLLVLSQEQERKHLVRLVHEVSLEDLQGAACSVPSNEGSNKQAALRNGCIKKLREIHISLQIHNKSQTPLEQANLHIQLQPEAQPQMQSYISSKPSMGSQDQLEDSALLLLVHLLELQEAQASALLPELMDMSVQHLQALQARYESELQAQNFTNLLQLLMSDGPLTSGSILTPSPNLTDNRSNEQTITQTPKPQNSNDRPAEALTYNSVPAADEPVCIGCGLVMEELPYLEILCVSDGTINTYQSATAGKEAQEEGSGSTASAQSYEKQGSLITLAWSKPPDGDTDYEAECADGGTAQSMDSESSESSVQTQVQSSDMSDTAKHKGCDEASGVSHDEESGSASQRDAQSAEQQCSTEEQLTSEEGPMVEQPGKEEAVSECDLQTHTPQAVPHYPFVDLPEIKPHTDDLCSGLCSEAADVGRDRVVMEACPTKLQCDLWDLREPDRADAEDQQHKSQTDTAFDPAERRAQRESMLMERQRVGEPISAIERERTMRNLVDMQKKVEQRQQRDRERQLLRVKERLSIIQNKKAEEDLLGLKHTDRLKHLTQDLPQEDKTQQKTVVRERLEQLRRERSYVMQSKRDRNTTGFKELLGPVTLYRETEDVTD